VPVREAAAHRAPLKLAPDNANHPRVLADTVGNHVTDTAPTPDDSTWR